MFIPTSLPHFYREFYAKCIQKSEPLENYVFVQSFDGSFGVEKKSFWLIHRFSELVQRKSYDFEAICHDLLKPLDVRHARSSSLSPANLEDKFVLLHEFIAAAKICHACDKLLKRRELYNTSLSSLRETFRVRRLFCLLQAGNIMNSSPLQTALRFGLFAEALLLMRHGAKLAEAKEYYAELLPFAFKKKKEVLCLDLIEEGVDLKGSLVDKETLLLSAIREQRPAVAMRLIQAHANVKVAKDNVHFLHLACEYGLEDVVKCLLDHGCPVNVTDEQGDTALHIAAGSLNSTLVKLLLSRKADPTKCNREQLVALQIPIQHHRASKEVDSFYKELLENFPRLCAEIDRVGAEDYFHERQRHVGRDLVQDSLKNNQNPFELAILLNDETIAKVIAPEIKKSQFCAYREALCKKYPESNLDVIDFSPYQIDKKHYQKAVTDAQVDVPSRDEPIDAFLDLFDQLEFDDSASPHFFDLEKVQNDVQDFRNVALLKQELEKMLDKIKGRTPFLGTPRPGPALELFYQMIEHALQNILIKIDETKRRSSVEADAMIARSLEELLRTMTYCGGKYFTNCVRLYLKICKGMNFSFDNEIYQTLSDYREVCFQHYIPNSDQSVHIYNALLYFYGKRYGLPGATIFSKFRDIFAHGDLVPICKSFDRDYTPKAVVKDWIAPKLQEAELRDKYVDWYKTCVPTSWRKAHFDDIRREIKKELHRGKSLEAIIAFLETKDVSVADGESYESAIQKERVYSFLGSQVFDAETGKKQNLAICEMLVKLNVFTSCYQFDECESPSFARIIGGYFSRVSNFLVKHSPLCK